MITKANIKASLLKIFTKSKILAVNKNHMCIQGDFESYCHKNGIKTAVVGFKNIV